MAMTNSELLKKTIEDKNFTTEMLADQMCISKDVLENKIEGKEQFSGEETNFLKALLNLSTDEAEKIFFADFKDIDIDR